MTFRDLRGLYTDWPEDRQPGGRDYQPPPEIPRPPNLHVLAPTPAPPASGASGAVLAPQAGIRVGAVVIPNERLDRRAELARARPPVSEDRGTYLLLKQLRASGDRGLAALKSVLAMSPAEVQEEAEKGLKEGLERLL
jgi:hypothetical protein